jgi:hypothetical protein
VPDHRPPRAGLLGAGAAECLAHRVVVVDRPLDARIHAVDVALDAPTLARNSPRNSSKGAR